MVLILGSDAIQWPRKANASWYKVWKYSAEWIFSWGTPFGDGKIHLLNCTLSLILFGKSFMGKYIYRQPRLQVLLSTHLILLPNYIAWVVMQETWHGNNLNPTYRLVSICYNVQWDYIITLERQLKCFYVFLYIFINDFLCGHSWDSRQKDLERAGVKSISPLDERPLQK